MNTVYFSKINLDSQEVYELTRNYEVRYAITRDVLEMVKNNYEFEDLHIYTLEDGESKEEKVKYSLLIRKKDDSSIEGILFRITPIFAKRRNMQTEEMVSVPVDNTEDIPFYYDVLHEYVAFVTRRRFGRQMFNGAFAKMLNECSKESGHAYSFYLETFNKGLSMAELKDIIRREHGIKELTLTYRPINPDMT